MNNVPTYRVRDWDRHFETHESRKRKGQLSWVGVPTKHDGRGFNRLKRQDDFAALYGCWVLILSIAAKCPVRGILADEDGPFTAMDIADKVGLPEDLVQRCLDLLISPETGVVWLEVSEIPGTQQHIPADTGSLAADLPQTPADIGTDPQISGPTIPNQTIPNHTKKLGASKKPKFDYYNWITAEKLADPTEVLDWHTKVVQVKNSPLQDTDTSRINALAAASTAIEKGNDPKAWFVWCIKTDKFKSITQVAEDAAVKTLKRLRRSPGGTFDLFANLVKSATPVTVPDVPEDEPFDNGEGEL